MATRVVRSRRRQRKLGGGVGSSGAVTGSGANSSSGRWACGACHASGQGSDQAAARIWVALAGPGSNLVQAIVWALLYVVYNDFGVTEKFFLAMCKAGVLSNVVMFAFNLFPLPPLDGGRVLVGLLPWRMAVGFSQVERYGFFIVMALVLLGVVNTLWMMPIMAASMQAIQWTLQPLAALLQLSPP